MAVKKINNMKKQPIEIVCKNKIIGYFDCIDHENKVLIFKELPKLLDVQVAIENVEQIINLSNKEFQSFYYRVK